MKYLRILILIILSMCFTHGGFAQEAPEFRMETRNGQVYIGKILFEDNKSLKVITKDQEVISLYKRDIIKTEFVDSGKPVSSRTSLYNPQATRYFLMNNGYGLKKGEGYYQNSLLLINQVAYAPTDHITFGIGTIPLFLVSGGLTPVWVSGKLSIPVVPETINVGIGMQTGILFDGTDNTGFGMAYGVTTLGSRDHNLSIGMGYGYFEGEWADTPTFNVSGMFRTSSRGYLITENYYLDTGNDQLALFSFGGRRLIKKVGLDFGLCLQLLLGSDELNPLPWVGVNIPF